MYYCCGITEKGLPPHNEDAMMMHHTVLTEGEQQIGIEEPFMAAVCDGVSGEQAGELASQTCLNLLSGVHYGKSLNLKRQILDIHSQIAASGKLLETTANMQTTLCGIAIDETNALHCFNVGDSRLYRFRNGTLEQISRDQTLVQMLYDEGTITSEQKMVHTHRHIVLPVIGNLDAEPKPEVVIYPDGLRLGDMLLLCTDGLTDYVSIYEIEEILAAPRPLPKRLHELTDAALGNGGKDNITMIAVQRYPDEIPIPGIQILYEREPIN
ncbi:MAG: serine/threonine-protein phosphatase [Oscillospiraceae bacterium]|nr:serine/threonine-protein phosphatase [Oscillospiraceae bacterium]